MDTYKAVHHDDYLFVRHSTGETIKRSDMTDEQIKFMMQNFKSVKERCIYEDDKVLVEHHIQRARMALRKQLWLFT